MACFFQLILRITYTIIVVVHASEYTTILHDDCESQGNWRCVRLTNGNGACKFGYQGSQGQCAGPDGICHRVSGNSWFGKYVPIAAYAGRPMRLSFFVTGSSHDDGTQCQLWVDYGGSWEEEGWILVWQCVTGNANQCEYDNATNSIVTIDLDVAINGDLGIAFEIGSNGDSTDYCQFDSITLSYLPMTTTRLPTAVPTQNTSRNTPTNANEANGNNDLNTTLPLNVISTVTPNIPRTKPSILYFGAFIALGVALCVLCGVIMCIAFHCCRCNKASIQDHIHENAMAIEVGEESKSLTPISTNRIDDYIIQDEFERNNRDSIHSNVVNVTKGNEMEVTTDMCDELIAEGDHELNRNSTNCNDSKGDHDVIGNSVTLGKTQGYELELIHEDKHTVSPSKGE